MPLKPTPACQSNTPAMGEDSSPALSWDTIPTGTQSIALIMDDPDSPGKTRVHLVTYNIPANTTALPPGVPKNNTLDDGSLQGKNDFGRIGYRTLPATPASIPPLRGRLALPSTE